MFRIERVDRDYFKVNGEFVGMACGVELSFGKDSLFQFARKIKCIIREIEYENSYYDEYVSKTIKKVVLEKNGELLKIELKERERSESDQIYFSKGKLKHNTKSHHARNILFDFELVSLECPNPKCQQKLRENYNEKSLAKKINSNVCRCEYIRGYNF